MEKFIKNTTIIIIVAMIGVIFTLQCKNTLTILLKNQIKHSEIPNTKTILSLHQLQ